MVIFLNECFTLDCPNCLIRLTRTPMSKTRLYVDCPACHMQYMVKEFSLTYSNGARIENVVDSDEFQQLICPCQPKQPFTFKLKERARLRIFCEDETEQTHFRLPVRKTRSENRLDL